MKTTNGRNFSDMSFSNKKVSVLNVIICACLVIVLVIYACIGLSTKDVLMFVLSLIGIIATFLINALIQSFVELCENISDINSNLKK